MSTELEVALIGAAATVLVAVAGGLATTLAPDWKASRDRKRQVKELEARYSDSLMRAAFSLQARLWNIVRLDFLSYLRGAGEERFHAVTSTQWLVGQYLGWVELLRRDAHSLALGGTARGQNLLALLARIEDIFATDRFPPAFRLWRPEQSALGELMIVERTSGDVRYSDCMGYATFIDNLQEQRFGRWFAPLGEALEAIGPEFARLVQLQGALLDLVEFLNRGKVPGLERLDRSAEASPMEVRGR